MKDFYQQSVVKPLRASLTLLHTGTVRKGDFGASRVLCGRSFLLLLPLVVLIHFLFFVGSYGCPRGCVIMNDDLFHESLLLRLTHWLLFMMVVMIYGVRYWRLSESVIFSYVIAHNWAIFLAELLVVSLSIVINSISGRWMPIVDSPFYFLLTGVPLIAFFMVYQWEVARRVLGASALASAALVFVDILLMSWVDAFSFPLALMSGFVAGFLTFLVV